MTGATTIKRRIGSVKNTRQITKAMELVAASKKKRAQAAAEAGRAYQAAALSLLRRLNTAVDVRADPLFIQRHIACRCYILITSNRGLAGAYNANAIKRLTELARRDEAEGVKTKVIALGLKGARFVHRLKGLELIATYPAFGDMPSANDIRPLLQTVLGLYRSADVDEVRIIYTKLISPIVQQTSELSVLPATFPKDELDASGPGLGNVTFEPSVEEVLESVTQRLIEVQLWQSLLESIASEHAMRMLAMKNATDNANDLINDLTLTFNTARQSAITQELAEITGGAEAMKEQS